MRSLDLERLRAIARAHRAAFAAARPYPHLVIEEILHPDVAQALTAEFAATRGDWIFYHHVNERKRGFNDVSRMGPVSRQVVADLNSSEFLAVLGALTGIPNLRADPELEGGGLSDIDPGGYINVHTDFLSHPTEHTWTRCLNLLVFLNDGWSEADGGSLELWDDQVREPVQRFVPLFNRGVIFATGPRAFHAVPAVTCSRDRSRKSLALYYFQDEGHARPIQSTNYVPRPDDTLPTRALIRLDRWLIHAYAALKHYTPMGDHLASRVLRLFSGKRTSRD
jgi:Rps23 Pro-64 3,4-dihydroxylase Tpa1-like proline 4-hydroxylase